eukprot:g7293.t1
MAKKNKPAKKAVGGRGSDGKGSKGGTLILMALLIAAVAVAVAVVLAGPGVDGTAGGTGDNDLAARRAAMGDPATWRKVEFGDASAALDASEHSGGNGKEADDVWERARAVLRRNPNATQVAADPDVWLVPGLISPEACDAIVAHSHQRYAQKDPQPRWCFASAKFDLPRRHPELNSVKDQAGDDCITDQVAGRRLAEEEKRYVSRSTMTAKAESELHDELGRVVSAATGLDEDHAFHHQVLEYTSGEEYSVHTDCNNADNDRAGTSLIYLTDVEEGGETCFPRRKTCVRPKKGSALFFASRTDGRCDKLSEHIARSVTKGKKIVVQRWYYTKYLIPTGEKDSVLCDIGNNCRHYMYNQSRVEAVELGEKGQAAKQQGRSSEAMALYRKGVQAYPTYPYTAAWLGEALANAGRNDEALPHFQNAIRAAGLFPDAHYFAGTLHQGAARLEEAAFHFRQVLKAQPQDQDAHFLLADTLEKQAGSAEGREARSLRKAALAEVRLHLRVNAGDNQALRLRAHLEANL